MVSNAFGFWTTWSDVRRVYGLFSLFTEESFLSVFFIGMTLLSHSIPQQTAVYTKKMRHLDVVEVKLDSVATKLQNLTATVQDLTAENEYLTAKVETVGK